MTQELFLVTINVATSLEEAMVDCLLTFESSQGFSSFLVNAHDHHNEGLSIAEQVTGRQRKMRFQMFIDQKNLSALIEKLKHDFSGTGLHYWIMPVLEHDEL